MTQRKTNKELGKDAVERAISQGVLSQEDYNRIQERNKLDEFDKDSITYKILLQCDAVRRQKDKNILDVKNMLKEVKSLYTRINKFKAMLIAGNITAELRPGVLLTEEEVGYEIYAAETMAWGNAKDIPHSLWRLRYSAVGHKDLVGNELMKSDEFDKFVIEVKNELKTIGLSLFEY